MTLASGTEGADWRIVAANAAITLISGVLSAWLKSKSKGGEK